MMMNDDDDDENKMMYELKTPLTLGKGILYPCFTNIWSTII